MSCFVLFEYIFHSVFSSLLKHLILNGVDIHLHATLRQSHRQTGVGAMEKEPMSHSARTRTFAKRFSSQNLFHFCIFVGVVGSAKGNKLFVRVFVTCARGAWECRACSKFLHVNVLLAVSVAIHSVPFSGSQIYLLSSFLLFAIKILTVPEASKPESNVAYTRNSPSDAYSRTINSSQTFARHGRGWPRLLLRSQLNRRFRFEFPIL